MKHRYPATAIMPQSHKSLMCILLLAKKERKTYFMHSLNAHNDGVKNLFHMLFLIIIDTDSFCLTQAQNYPKTHLAKLIIFIFPFVPFVSFLLSLELIKHHWLACRWTSVETCSFSSLTLLDLWFLQNLILECLCMFIYRKRPEEKGGGCMLRLAIKTLP